MNTAKDTELTVPADENRSGVSGVSRRSFFKNAAVAGAGLAVAGAGLLTNSSAVEAAEDDAAAASSGLVPGDRAILIAAEIAEALAVTTYTNIIDLAPFFKRIPDDDQGYLIQAREEEMSHYALEQSATGEDSPFDQFFYPHGMFEDAQTTLNTLVTLEDAFIAAYLLGVRNFSRPSLRYTAARIMGIESDHRTLARVVGPDVAKQDGGPIKFITGAQGVKESVAPPNNNGYERTLCWTMLTQALDALSPFVSKQAAESAGFNISKAYTFHPFVPKLPNPLGDFISFTGC